MAASAGSGLRFAVIGVDHAHIHGQMRLMLDAGAACAGYAPFDPLSDGSSREAAAFLDAWSGLPVHADHRPLLDDPTVHLVLSSIRPARRPQVAEAVLDAGKDLMLDKPLAVSTADLDTIVDLQRRSGRIVAVDFSERVENPAMVRAGELVRAGAIGRVVQTIGLGPHSLRKAERPDWFFRRADYGGIIIDIGSHQIDHILHFTGAADAEIVSSAVAIYANPDRPELEDFGEVQLITGTGHGFFRVDWMTPAGLCAWGDGRFFVLGDEGTVEVRKVVDPAGRPGGNHLILVTGAETRYVDCSDVRPAYGEALCRDIRDRTETAMRQDHVFAVSRLALDAQRRARRLGHLDRTEGGGTPAGRPLHAQGA